MKYYRTSGFNPECKACELGCGKAIAGQSEVEFDQIKLIIVSAYPGNRELKLGISLAPALDNKRAGDLKRIPDSRISPVGAGEFLRFCLEQVFDKDPEFPDEFKPIEKYTYFTNAIKCSPQKGNEKITVLPKHIRACRDEYLLSEIRSFPNQVPILACAGEAVKALLGIEESLIANRNKVCLFEEHPLICSTNPIDWEKYSMYFISDPEAARKEIVKLNKMGKLNKLKNNLSNILGMKRWKPMIGSPLWFVKQDLQLLKTQVNKYIKENDYSN